MRYAVAIGEIDPYAMVEDAFVDLQVAYGAGLGTRPDRHQAIRVEGACVSSLRRRRGRLELRAFNPADADRLLTIEGWRGDVVDLRGEVLAPFEGSVLVRPHGIVTLALEEG
jgi:hypothetical protein